MSDTTEIKRQAQALFKRLGGYGSTDGRIVSGLLTALEKAEEQIPATPTTGTVAELRQALEGVDDEMRVVMSRDAEGNGYSPFAEAGVMYYSPSTGDVVDQDEMTEYGQHDSRPALVLWPVG